MNFVLGSWANKQKGLTNNCFAYCVNGYVSVGAVYSLIIRLDTAIAVASLAILWKVLYNTFRLFLLHSTLAKSIVP